MKSEIEKLLSLLKRTFEKGAWHGPSVMEVLQDITPVESSQRLPNTHSIIELVAHMTSWRTFTTKRLSGDELYEVNDSMNFPVPTDWHQTLSALQASQQELFLAVEHFPIEKLSALVPHTSHKYTYYTLIHGIIHHDLYHIGQINLIRKAAAASTL